MHRFTGPETVWVASVDGPAGHVLLGASVDPRLAAIALLTEADLVDEECVEPINQLINQIETDTWDGEFSTMTHGGDFSWRLTAAHNIDTAIG
jgi:hypothetical protein